MANAGMNEPGTEFSMTSKHGDTEIIMHDNGHISYWWKFSWDFVDNWANRKTLGETPPIFAEDFAKLLTIAANQGMTREVGIWGWIKRKLGGWDTWIA